jgi:hypothetical protein
MGPEPKFPTPRVMSAEVLVNRYLADVAMPTFDTDLVQLWVVGRDQVDETGHPMLRVAVQALDGSSISKVIVSMRKSTYDSLHPLATLVHLPDDLESIDDVDAEFTEPRLVASEPVVEEQSAIPSVDDAHDLADRWSQGETPIRETIDFLERSVAEVPQELAVSDVQVMKMLVNENFGQDADVQIITLCRGLALVLDLPPF